MDRARIAKITMNWLPDLGLYHSTTAHVTTKDYRGFDFNGRSFSGYGRRLVKMKLRLLFIEREEHEKA